MEIVWKGKLNNMGKGKIQLLNNQRIINIMESILNHVDPRLIDHGKRVAYLIFKILYPLQKFEDKHLRDICLLALLHDIGAYKTEEIDNMVVFETIDVWEHSIYGYLFLKYFSPLKELAPVILFHHADCDEVIHLEDPEQQMLAQLICICDRADVYTLGGGNTQGFRNYLDTNRDMKYRSDMVDMFLDAGIDIDTVFDHVDSDAVFHQIFRDTAMADEDVEGYVNMIVSSIDFRSHQTVIHTVSSTCVAVYLAEHLGAKDVNEINKMKTGAILHDVGKIGIPVSILESTEKLNSAELEIMRTHVDITGKILDGNVDDEVKQISIKHHEKLNGTGYPLNLSAENLNEYERVMAVADVFSALCQSRTYKNAYPKEKVLFILEDMSAQNLLDASIVSLAIEHYDEIDKEIDKASIPTVQAYNAINEEYVRVRGEIKNKYTKCHK